MSSLRKKSIKNVRSPRRIAACVEHLPQSFVDQLLAPKRKAKLMKVADTAEGGERELAEWLWESSQAQAQEALDTGFIQGIKSGLLDPTDYGGYTVQDAVYCFNATSYYGIAYEKCKESTLREFIQGRIKSYAGYTEEMFKQWYIKDPRGIAMGTAAASYSSFEKGVATNSQAIYLLIAMLPCEQLWGWLAEQIQPGINDTNVYSFWIEDNLGGSHKLANFINEHTESYGVRPEVAKGIYKTAMQCEVEFFRSATIDVV
ncbi:uncharacterized protein LOC119723538 [Patiria miniata]|uniref:Thiaminase-2/PQQC domain-containing protein n=1 Tax=Patiria miniata TaxID=46514 RepID=A0A913ZGM9_PATMI|nr:uncharacterized protein LOC119723538 [Patiria miniata]XP_038050171.1 uncharacterized protein LOC119723538 [Patiria miniata]